MKDLKNLAWAEAENAILRMTLKDSNKAVIRFLVHHSLHDRAVYVSIEEASAILTELSRSDQMEQPNYAV